MKRLKKGPLQIPIQRYPKQPKVPASLGRDLVNLRRSLRNSLAASSRLVDLLDHHGFDPSNRWAIQAGCIRDAAAEALTWYVDLVNLVSGSEGVPPENASPRGHLKSDEGATDTGSEGETP